MPNTNTIYKTHVEKKYGIRKDRTSCSMDQLIPRKSNSVPLPQIQKQCTTRRSPLGSAILVFDHQKLLTAPWVEGIQTELL